MGTGLIGGFPTFSAYAHAVDLLAAGGLTAIAVAYLAGSVLTGVVGAAAGITGGVRLAMRAPAAIRVPDGGTTA